MSRHALGGNGGTPCPVLKPLSNQMSRCVRVSRQVCLLGAHPRVHLPLQSPMVSRTHAMIVIDGAETYVRDLASRNGVYLNGHVVRESRLRHGDLLCVGPYAFWWSANPLPSPRPRHFAAEAADQAATLSVNGEKSPRRMEGHTFLIGRRPDCDLAQDSCMIDAAHAVIYRRAGKFSLRDLNSKSGTFVNNRRTRETELRRGDEIRVGLTRLHFEPPAPPPAAEDEFQGGDEETMTGLAAMINSDQPAGPEAAETRSCPTIEQLLGAVPNRITQWERPAIRQRTIDFDVPRETWLELA